MTPLASVAMLEKLALLKIALCNAPVVSRASECPVGITAPFAPGVRRSEGLLATVIPYPLSGCRIRASGSSGTEVGLGVRPNAQRLKRVLRDETAVLAYDHYGGDGCSLSSVPLHRRLYLDPGVFADRPLTIVATRAA